jgi:hypothetical protein
MLRDLRPKNHRFYQSSLPGRAALLPPDKVRQTPGLKPGLGFLTRPGGYIRQDLRARADMSVAMIPMLMTSPAIIDAWLDLSNRLIEGE